MTRPFRPADFKGRDIVGGRCLTRLAPSATPSTAADRTFTFVFSNADVDRYGDKIDPAGWDLTNYRTNPVVLFGHDAGAVANVVGRAKNVRVQGGQLLGDIEFMPATISELAETVYQMVRDGFLNAVSVGFAPVEWKAAHDKSRPGGIDITKAELLEVSIVPIPALPSALIQARAAGIDGRPVAAWAAAQLASKETTMSRATLELVKRDFSAPPAARAPIASAAPISRPAGGFSSFGDFLRAAAKAASTGEPDRRLTRAATGLGEADPSAGGFTVPTEWTTPIIDSIYAAAVIAPLCDRREVDDIGNVKLPAISEASRADGSRSGGAQAFWLNEGDLAPYNFPRFRQVEFAPKKLIALVPTTEELFRDVRALETYMSRVLANEISFKLDLALLKGTGAGTPLGVVGAPGTIQIAKANGQSAGSIVAENIASMWSRLAAPCRKRAVWLINEDAEAQLEQIGASGGTASATGMYFPAGAAGGNPYPLLKGRPVLVVEQASLLGTPGDIVLGDFSEYVLIERAMKADLSLDVLFASNQAVFRFVYRCDGRPAWSTPITPYNGGVSRAAFVTLAQR